MTDATLDIFLAHCETPWRRGVSDCFVAAADQALAWFGADPMARYRGRYASQHGYLRIIRKDGYRTPEQAFAGEMERAGFARVQGPAEDGDIALCGFVDGGRPTIAPALRFEGGWNLRSKGGWLFLMDDRGIRETWRYGN